MPANGKFHIGKSGPAPCHATVRACIYAKDTHYDTLQEAEKAYAVKMQEEQGADALQATSKKDVKAALRLRLTTMKPHEVDVEAAPLYAKLGEARYHVDALEDSIGRMRGEMKMNERYHKRAKDDRYLRRNRDLEARIKLYQEQKLPPLQEAEAKAAAELEPYNTEWSLRAHWERPHLTVGGDGKIHRDDENCSSLNNGRFRTRMAWLPQLSGKSEEEIVQEAGWRACTKCYKSAPINATKESHPSRITSEEDKAKQAAKEEREAKKAERAAKEQAKGISTPEGKPLVIGTRYPQTIRTEAEAKREFMDSFIDEVRQWEDMENKYGMKAYASESSKAHHAMLLQEALDKREKLLDALAHKNGMTTEEYQAMMQPKIDANLRKQARELEKYMEAYRREEPEAFL